MAGGWRRRCRVGGRFNAPLIRYAAKLLARDEARRIAANIVTYRSWGNKNPSQGAALELIAYSSPHDAELFADSGVETEPGSARCNGIGKCHIVVVNIDE